MQIRAALIVDNLLLTEWQKRALEEASEYLDISLVLSCQNTKTKKRFIKNFAYYVLNFLSLKNDLTRKTTYKIKNAKVVNFNSIYNGMWQSIPLEVSQQIKSENIKLIIKFGMSLLKIDDSISDFDILSFHHGDPEYYRGRPAGFYELYNNTERVGIIVQKLTNQLDAGDILIREYSKIYHYSYKKTARNFYLNSQVLLRKALINYLSNKNVVIPKFGQNYRLPSNKVVVKFALKMIYRKIIRILYGLFFEKKWNIIKLGFKGVNNINDISIRDGQIPKIKKGYSFYADPFFNKNGDKIRIEALNSINGLGEIIEIDSNDFSISTNITLKGEHYSYPYSFIDDGIEYILPEVASHSSPYLLKEPFDITLKKPLEGLDNIRLVDSTLIRYKGMYYLFGGKAHLAADNLYLYISENISGPYRPHPQNPIVMDPKSARMGGRIYCYEGKIYRFGQDNCYGYGSKITVNEIEELSSNLFSEKKVGCIAFNDARGPHTLDINGDSMILDFYVDKFSIFAGCRRIAAILFKKRSNSV